MKHWQWVVVCASMWVHAVQAAPMAVLSIETAGNGLVRAHQVLQTDPQQGITATYAGDKSKAAIQFVHQAQVVQSVVMDAGAAALVSGAYRLHTDSGPVPAGGLRISGISLCPASGGRVVVQRGPQALSARIQVACADGVARQAMIHYDNPVDADADGVDDGVDLCLEPTKDPVGRMGCSHTQFCARNKVSGACFFADWKLDGQGDNPKDCTWNFQTNQCSALVVRQRVCLESRTITASSDGKTRTLCVRYGYQ